MFTLLRGLRFPSSVQTRLACIYRHWKLQKLLVQEGVRGCVEMSIGHPFVSLIVGHEQRRGMEEIVKVWQGFVVLFGGNAVYDACKQGELSTR